MMERQNNSADTNSEARLQISFPLEGEVLNTTHLCTAPQAVGRRDGRNTGRIEVCGKTRPDREISVNGLVAGRSDACDGSFRVSLPLGDTFETVRISDGRDTLTRRFVFDSDSRKRYNFFIDDNVFFLDELHRCGHRSIFDSFYLAFLRRMHREYGTKFTLNSFWRNDHDHQDSPSADDARQPFNCSMLSDRWKGEFEENSDWLRLSFHALSEFPDAPYTTAHPEKVAEHHRIVTEQIRRYAGEKTLIEPVLLHFYTVSDPAGRHFLREQGMRCYTLPPRVWQQLEQETGRLPLAFYNDEFKQLELQLEFMCNLYPASTLLERLQTAYAHGHKNILNIGTHEQYFYPFYSAYIPEHQDRVEAVLRDLSEHGYESIYFTEELLNNPSF